MTIQEQYRIIQNHLFEMSVLFNSTGYEVNKYKKRFSLSEKKAIAQEINSCKLWLEKNYENAIEIIAPDTVGEFYLRQLNPDIKHKKIGSSIYEGVYLNVQTKRYSAYRKALKEKQILKQHLCQQT